MPKLTNLLLIVFTSTTLAKSQNVPLKVGSRFSTADVQQFLNHHNRARSEINKPPLQWNESIAAYAQEWAEYLANKEKCKLIHRHQLNQNKEDYGENIYWGSSAKYFTPLDASVAWYKEKDIFKNEHITWESLPKTGHYTQMIWESTTEVGAGKAICPSGSIIIVANYNPAGNIIGSHP